MTDRPKIVDDDCSEISVMLGGKELRAWFYADEADRREKMRAAWSFCDGFICATQEIGGDVPPLAGPATGHSTRSTPPGGAQRHDETAGGFSDEP